MGFAEYDINETTGYNNDFDFNSFCIILATKYQPVKKKKKC